MTDKKPKEGVKTENGYHMIWRRRGRMVPPRSLRWRGTHHLASGRKPMWPAGCVHEADPIPIWWAANQWERHTHTVGNGGWRYHWCVPAADRRCPLKREPATLFLQTKETFSEDHNLVPPHPDHYSIVFSVLSFSASPFLVCVTSVCAQTYCLLAFWPHNAPTRDGTRATAVETWGLNHWTAREFPLVAFFLN